MILGEPAPTDAAVRAAYQRSELADEAHRDAAVLLAETVVQVPPADEAEVRFQRLNYLRARALAEDARDEHDDLYDQWTRSGGAVRLIG